MNATGVLGQLRGAHPNEKEGKALTPGVVEMADYVANTVLPFPWDRPMAGKELSGPPDSLPCLSVRLGTSSPQ